MYANWPLFFSSKSGLCKRRLALARALYAAPPLLLLDDPLSALDALCASHVARYALLAGRYGRCGTAVQDDVTHGSTAVQSGGVDGNSGCTAGQYGGGMDGQCGGPLINPHTTTVVLVTRSPQVGVIGITFCLTFPLHISTNGALHNLMLPVLMIL